MPIPALFRALVQSALLGLVLAASFAAKANEYTIVDLGPIDIFAKGINDREHVIAWGYWDGVSSSAKVYRNGKWRSVGSPEDKPVVHAINRHGDIAGSIGQSSTLWPVLFPREGGTLKLELPPGAAQGEATAFSGLNTVVGEYFNADLDRFGCFMTRRNGHPLDMGLPPGGVISCHPQAASEGWVAGTAITGPEEVNWVWKDGVFTVLGDWKHRAYPRAVNKLGHVVGDGREWGFFWDGVQLHNIGVSDRFNDTSASSINDHDEIVGTASYTHSWRAIRFEGKEAILLNSEVRDRGDWVLETADVINNDGVIVGYGTLAGSSHGYMLIPIPK